MSKAHYVQSAWYCEKCAKYHTGNCPKVKTTLTTLTTPTDPLEELKNIISRMATGGRDYAELTTLGKEEVDYWVDKFLALIHTREQQARVDVLKKVYVTEDGELTINIDNQRYEDIYDFINQLEAELTKQEEQQ